jgi:hypothetical protein
MVRPGIKETFADHGQARASKIETYVLTLGRRGWAGGVGG